MGDYDFVEYKLSFKQALNLPISALNELYPVLYSDWLYKVFESAWQRLFAEDFPVSDVKISSGFPFYKDGAHVLFFDADSNEYVSVVRDELSKGELKYALGCWRFMTRPRAEFNKKNSRREKRYTTAEMYFKENAGIWLGARFKDNKIRTKFESVVRFVGEEGIGGGRSVGYGAFELSGVNEVSLYKEENALVLSLSRFAVPEETNTDDLFVEIRPMTVSLKSAKDGAKKQYSIFGEGSILQYAEGMNPFELGTFIGEDAKDAKKYSKRPAFLFAMPIPAKLCNLQTK